MTSLREELLRTYGPGTVAQVHAGASYRELCGRRGAEPGFDAQRYRMETLRTRVDKSLDPERSARRQVELALRLLRRLDDRDDEADAAELVRQSFGLTWSGAQLDFFLLQARAIGTGVQYFLSFTDRNPGRAQKYLNKNNLNHHYFIVNTIGKDPYDAGDPTRNLLARAVDHVLRAKFPSRFFYPDHEADNAVVEQKLRDNCARTAAFVQLVQGDMFRRADARNWCHFEYELVSGDPLRVLFVQIEDGFGKDDVWIDFDAWYDAFAAKDVVRLSATRVHDTQAIRANYAQLDALEAQIRRVMDRVYQGIPN